MESESNQTYGVNSSHEKITRQRQPQEVESRKKSTYEANLKKWSQERNQRMEPTSRIKTNYLIWSQNQQELLKKQRQRQNLST